MTASIMFLTLMIIALVLLSAGIVKKNNKIKVISLSLFALLIILFVFFALSNM